MKIQERKNDNGETTVTYLSSNRLVIEHDYSDENEYLTMCRICKGDGESFGKIVKEYQNIALNWTEYYAFIRYGRGLNDYEKDIVQDMWIILMGLIPRKFKVEGDRAECVYQFYCYLERAMFRTLKRLIRNHMKKKIKEKVISFEDCEEFLVIEPEFDVDYDRVNILDMEILLKNEILKKALVTALEELDEKKKKVLELVLLTSLSTDQIGDKLSISRKTVQNYRSEAYRKLKDANSKNKNDDKDSIIKNNNSKKKTRRNNGCK